MNPKQKIILYNALALICLLIFFSQIQGCYKHFKWKKTTKETYVEPQDIKVVWRNPKRGYHRNTASYEIKYTFYLDNKPYNGRARIQRSKQRDNIYTKMKILYNPKNPNENYYSSDLKILYKILLSILAFFFSLVFKGMAMEEREKIEKP